MLPAACVLRLLLRPASSSTAGAILLFEAVFAVNLFGFASLSGPPPVLRGLPCEGERLLLQRRVPCQPCRFRLYSFVVRRTVAPVSGSGFYHRRVGSQPTSSTPVFPLSTAPSGSGLSPVFPFGGARLLLRHRVGCQPRPTGASFRHLLRGLGSHSGRIHLRKRTTALSRVHPRPPEGDADFPAARFRSLAACCRASP